MNSATRAILVRARARAFARSVKGANMALKIPDETIDWLTDAEVPVFKEHLANFGLEQRKDFYWEERTFK